MFELTLEMLCYNRISLISKVTVLDVSFQAGGLSFRFLYRLHQRELASTLQTETVGEKSPILCERCYISGQCEANIELRLAQHATLAAAEYVGGLVE